MHFTENFLELYDLAYPIYCKRVQEKKSKAKTRTQTQAGERLVTVAEKVDAAADDVDWEDVNELFFHRHLAYKNAGERTHRDYVVDAKAGVSGRYLPIRAAAYLLSKLSHHTTLIKMEFI